MSLHVAFTQKASQLWQWRQGPHLRPQTHKTTLQHVCSDPVYESCWVAKGRSQLATENTHMSSLKRWVGHCLQKHWAGLHLTVDNITAGSGARAEGQGRRSAREPLELGTSMEFVHWLPSCPPPHQWCEIFDSSGTSELGFCLRYRLDFLCFILIPVWWWFSYLDHKRQKIFKAAFSEVSKDSGAKLLQSQTTCHISIPARRKTFSNWKLNKQHREMVIFICPPVPSIRPSHSKHSIHTGY